jgi:Cdc6-like AAA superfamily ATPase
MPRIRNPFIVGGPVPPERFIGREREINAILNRLTDTIPGSSAIHGEARIGKTSLLHYLRSDEVAKEWKLSPNKFTFCLLDCGGIGTPFYLNFWRTAIHELQNRTQSVRVAQQLANFSLSKDHPSLNLRDLCRNLSLLKHRFVLLLDEFENVVKHDIYLLDTLRALVNEQLISMVISTTSPLPDMVKSIDFGGGQAFDRPFTIRELKYFSEKETRELINKALAGTNFAFDEDDYQYIWGISQGHPFKIQFACSRIFEDKMFS